MRNFKTSTIVMLAMGLLLFACTPDGIAPSEGKKGDPTLSGAMGDAHPALDSICQTADTVFLVREDDGSPVVNKCFGPGGMVTCAPNQMKWGYMELKEGYFGGKHYVDCNFTMAPGWYSESNNWEMGEGSGFQFDNNGIPVIGTDWKAMAVNPVQNKWQIRMEGEGFPTNGVDISLRVSAVRLNLFGAVTPGSATLLWGKNRNWADNANPAHSSSPWLLHFAPQRCMSTPPTPVESKCVAFYTGNSVLGTCTTISANTTGLTGVTGYAWSTGETTASISVCPTATTTYSVTISGAGGAPLRINEVTVNTIDAACGNGSNAGLKVFVCHVPPGNPSNVQEICISPSALPAHVARFRVAGSNPNQGHDSGCEIGRCGSNPCL